MATTRFVFYWEIDEEHDPEAYFNTPEGSTVNQKTLRELGYEIPLMPSYEEWLTHTESGKRCSYCWADKKCIHGERSYDL